jgi:hypothetical protein
LGHGIETVAMVLKMSDHGIENVGVIIYDIEHVGGLHCALYGHKHV